LRAREQIVGPERRLRVSHLDWSGDGCLNSRRPVNSTVMPSPLFENRKRVGLLRVDQLVAIARDGRRVR
jgi:hypothetical protein